jgi:hypothetical protein
MQPRTGTTPSVRRPLLLFETLLGRSSTSSTARPRETHWSGGDGGCAPSPLSQPIAGDKGDATPYPEQRRGAHQGRGTEAGGRPDRLRPRGFPTANGHVFKSRAGGRVVCTPITAVGPRQAPHVHCRVKKTYWKNERGCSPRFPCARQGPWPRPMSDYRRPSSDRVDADARPSAACAARSGPARDARKDGRERHETGSSGPQGPPRCSEMSRRPAITHLRTG